MMARIKQSDRIERLEKLFEQLLAMQSQAPAPEAAAEGTQEVKNAQRTLRGDQITRENLLTPAQRAFCIDQKTGSPLNVSIVGSVATSRWDIPELYVLVYPATSDEDATVRIAGFNPAAKRRNGKAYWLTKDTIDEFIDLLQQAKAKLQ